MNDELSGSSQYESAIFALANSFLKSLKESTLIQEQHLPYFDQIQELKFTYLMSKAPV
ncbi:hypothetical protein ODV21_07975 [Lactobacillus amylovorus]|uniref:hypothetical protein n=1 Tax=Lactobacillus amylovorus TaxID=1604 RepID=UPI00232AD559|nr:hypothetical protein [Lactobacillus amylovorus]MDB6243540.1 hypothetical protein [Lactobacillus amylovorus]